MAHIQTRSKARETYVCSTVATRAHNKPLGHTQQGDKSGSRSHSCTKCPGRKYDTYASLSQIVRPRLPVLWDKGLSISRERGSLHARTRSVEVSRKHKGHEHEKTHMGRWRAVAQVRVGTHIASLSSLSLWLAPSLSLSLSLSRPRALPSLAHVYRWLSCGSASNARDTLRGAEMDCWATGGAWKMG